MFTFKLFTLTLILLTIFNPRHCSAHSFTISPRGDFKNFRKPECRLGGPSHSPNDKCRGPCIEKSSWQYRSRNPVVYRRGQRVRMVWTRNNHHGGFVRFTLVPARDRMNHTTHNRMAFRYACFDSDKTPCPFANCGTDIPRLMHRAWVVIPTSYPNGRYVLGWSWFGGVTMNRSYFGDYWSCRDVIIRGGPFTRAYRPVFHPGENLPYAKKSRRQQCYSTVNALDICRREPCTGHRAKFMRPRSFAAGRRPQRILAAWMSPTSKPKMQPSPSASSSPSASPSPSSKSKTGRRARVVRLLVLDIGRDEVMAKNFPTVVQFKTRRPKLTFIAETEGGVKAVHFFINRKFIRSEEQSPYSCFGDVDMEYYHWVRPIFRKWMKVTTKAVDMDGRKHVRVFWMKLKPAVTSGSDGGSDASVTVV